MSFSKVNAAGWAVGDTLTSAQITQLDTDHANALDKTGDTVASGSTITYASGATQTFAVGSTLNINTANANVNGRIAVNATAAIEAQSGGIIQCLSGSYFTMNGTGVVGGSLKTQSGGRYVLGDGDYPTFSAARTLVRSRMLSEFPMPVTTGWTASYISMLATGTAGQLYFPLVDLIDGATLTKVEAIFIPSGSHVGQPSTLPSISVLRRTINTGISYAGSAVDLSASAGQSYSWVSLSDYNNTTEKALVYNATVNNVIDRSQYVYNAIVTDESGTNALSGAAYIAVRYTMTVGDLRYV